VLGAAIANQLRDTNTRKITRFREVSDCNSGDDMFFRGDDPHNPQLSKEIFDLNDVLI
tara:strand:+ start:295 stop:468 length:174 start_codon:yes stop_codon:yes gene_type:complete